jgi:hypothetical protein
MQKCLHDQIGKNVHVYVDDVIIKSKESRTLVDDLRETFANLRQFQMKLNRQVYLWSPGWQTAWLPCVKPGIEANPGKIRAMERMELPQDLKMCRTGCLASLSRFVSRLGEKALPLYQLMKKSDTFV